MDDSHRFKSTPIGTRLTRVVIARSSLVVTRPSAKLGRRFLTATLVVISFDGRIRRTLPPSLTPLLSGLKGIDDIVFCCDGKELHSDRRRSRRNTQRLSFFGAPSMFYLIGRGRIQMFSSITADAYVDAKVTSNRSSTHDAPPPVFTGAHYAAY